MATRVAGRRVTRLRAVGALLVVLVVLGVGGAASTAAFNQLNGPEQAVLDYASLLADGRASAAARRVPPVAARNGVLVPALVSDAALARATTRIRPLSAAVETGRPEGADVPVGQVVTVDLTYGLGQQSGVARLRVRRDPDGFPFTHTWKVLDPLLVPVVVETNLTSLPAPTLAGVSLPVTGATSGTGSTGGTVSPVMVYPGIYPLTTPSYRLLTADVGAATPTLVAVHPAKATYTPWAVAAPLTWTGSSALLAQVASGVVTDLTTCVTAGPRMSAELCPAALFELRNLPGLASTVTPSGLVVGGPSGGPDGSVRVAFTYSTPAIVRWNGGARATRTLPVSGMVTFGPDDTLAVPTLSTS